MRHYAKLTNWPWRNALVLRNLRRSSTAPAANGKVREREKEVEKPYYVTSPIFYVNAAPHIGHLYTMVLTDILKRWQELRGRRAILSTGTDEHGMKVQQAAMIAGVPPKEFCDGGAGVFESLAQHANVAYDHFIRTTDKRHHDAVESVWNGLKAGGHIYSGKHEGWYSVSDETFFPESSTHMILDPQTGQKVMVSSETGKTVEWAAEHNYHFRLSDMAPQLLSFYEQHPDFILPAARHKDVVDAVKSGLTDLSISRPSGRLPWGIPVPNDPEQTIYVWLDALVNYITASGYPWTPGTGHRGGWPADVHVIGKDIVRFHCIYWPAFLLALDLPLPKRVLAHAHWTMNRRKMSKSVGNVVNPSHALERYGVDAMRFYLAHDGGIVDDGDYSNEGIVERYKKSLQDGLGNLAGRVRGKNFDMRAAVARGVDKSLLGRADAAQAEMLESLAERVAEKMQRLEVGSAIKETMDAIYQTNKYLQHAAPWREENLARQYTNIFLSSEATRIAAILLQPVMPAKMNVLLDALRVALGRRGFADASFGADVDYGVAKGAERSLLFPPLGED